MKIRLEASAGTLELITALKTAPTRLRQVQRKEAFWLGEALVNRAKTEYRSAKWTTNTATRVRTGHLRNAYTHSLPTDTGTGVTFEFGVLASGIRMSSVEGDLLRPPASPLEYAAVQEFGATIRPKTGSFLAIPIGVESNQRIGKGGYRTAMTARGVSRGWPRDYPKGVLFRGKEGTRLSPRVLYQRLDTGVLPMFLLVKEVTIPPRPALLTSVQDVLPAWVERFTTALDKATTEAT